MTMVTMMMLTTRWNGKHDDHDDDDIDHDDHNDDDGDQVKWRTIAGSAVEGEDYEGAEGELVYTRFNVVIVVVIVTINIIIIIALLERELRAGLSNGQCPYKDSFWAILTQK